MCIYIPTCISGFLLIEASGVIPVVISTHTIYTLISKYPKKESGSFGEMAVSRAKQRKYKSFWNIFCKTVRTLSKTDVSISKEQWSHHEGTFTGQISDNMSIRMNKNRNGL